MLLLIDNHDSFTFNLVDLLRKIGVETKVVSVETLNLEEVNAFSHIMISPGPDVPSAYPQLFAMLERYQQTKSILGVCLGHQTLCEFFGGTLYNLDNVRHGQQRSLTQILDNPLFEGLPKQFNIGLYHSWAISQNSLENTPLVATAFCDQNVLMAVKHQNLRLYGVQFHPESFITEFGEQILRNWLST
ncbi:anthranilate synthase component II [Vespertiliibacter pulmonis]|uniref:Aminodeoxychorismate synthase glutamine amidotransferase subunit n=1 Tax=Vespertiliibacter pulmonis TaxID=1443036 RepID=A0A3N4VUT9_9PAST|nr:anthranilate synthase component II [Vespertiliibacter pulmonis]QLB20519.1 anthranilate synthase component II [Vespertiliibacter pulmonis]RPE80827.1 aminodeoxychorismate synthase glutamine amidotransferase subunit [Vespertiliibacter pulmonis]